MASLSTPIGELQARYGVVVVGSGYGGAVAASRMASLAKELHTGGKPAFSVCVLERGLEIQPGEYPSSAVAALGQLQADTPVGRVGRRTGLYDFRINRDLSVLLGCGLGGGSLINAGVMLPPSADVLSDPRWPATLREAGLEREFERVRATLDVSQVPESIPLLKVTRLLEAGRSAGPDVIEGARPPIAVSFQTRVNAFGVQQRRCILCGDCMTGCNHAAKNTLIMNYLPHAASAGAAVFCGVDVRAIRPGDGSWRLDVQILDPSLRGFGSPEFTIHARAVFLAAGALGTTEILFRSRVRGLTLSPQIGKRFSGNGDVIAFAYNAAEPVNGVGYASNVPRDASVGPLIAGMLDERSHQSGAMIQEGSIPGVLAPVLRFAAPFMARWSFVPGDSRFDFLLRPLWRELDSMIRGAHHGALLRTQILLAMGRDAAAGEMRPSRGRLEVRWPASPEPDVIAGTARRLGDLTRAMRGRYVINPFWARLFGRRRVTVHPLGGAGMADRAEDGVVDGDGRVFSGGAGTAVHDGLYVCDGAVMPLALGTNPALTIGALAERIASRARQPIARLTKRDDPPVRVPGCVRRSVPGIRYAERLRGHMRFDGVETPFKLTLQISAESLDALIRQPAHTAAIVGVCETPALDAGRRRFTVSNGAFHVMTDDFERVDSKCIAYEFELTSEAGEVFTWRGAKVINHTTVRKGLWRVVSSYSFKIRDRGGVVVASGVARSTVLDGLRLVAGMRITDEPNRFSRVRATLRYWWYFASSVLHVTVRPLIVAHAVNPLARPTVIHLSADVAQLASVDDARKQERGGARFKLTRYGSASAGGAKGPVILAPGFGMSTYAFRLTPSLTEFLSREGYDVWLLDYRASDELAASLEQFTLDDLAVGDGTFRGDFPDAIEQVYEATGRQRVQIVAHCVASLTVFMSLLAGTLTEQHVKAVVLSQSFPFIDQPMINRLKGWIRLPQLLKWLGFRPVMTADYDLRSGWKNKLLDRLLRLYPSRERCTNGVCRRLLLMYGEVIRHDQIDRPTHDLMHDLFDRANLTTFEHLAKMAACGRIVDRKGKNTYLTPEKTRGINVPITLIQGMANGLFRPRGGERTHEWLLAHGGHGAAENKTRFRLVKLEGYGHLDTFIGSMAPREVFPRILESLDRWI